MSIIKKWTDDLSGVFCELLKYKVDSQEELIKMQTLEQQGYQINLNYCINNLPDGSIEKSADGNVIRYYLLSKPITEGILFISTSSVYDCELVEPEDDALIYVISRSLDEIHDRTAKLNAKTFWRTTKVLEADYIGDGIVIDANAIVITESAKDLKDKIKIGKGKV